MLAVQILEDQRAPPLGCADLQQLCFPFARIRVGLSDAIAVPSLQSHCCPGIASASGGCTPCRASRQSDKPEPHDSHLVCFVSLGGAAVDAFVMVVRGLLSCSLCL